MGDESLIYHQYLDAYKLSKCNINIISWLGIWYINNSLYENAINIFKNAHLIQPKQIKWRLMIASCYRRMRNFEKSINIYLSILSSADRDESVSLDITIKCLQYLCTIMKQIGHEQLEKYQNKLDEQLEIQQQMIQHQNIKTNNNMQQQLQYKEEEEEEEEEEEDTNWADVH